MSVGIKAGQEVAAGLVMLALYPTRSRQEKQSIRETSDILTGKEEGTTGLHHISPYESDTSEDIFSLEHLTPSPPPPSNLAIKSKKYSRMNRSDLFHTMDQDDKRLVGGNISSLSSHYALAKRSLLLDNMNRTRYPLARMRWIVRTAFEWRHVLQPDVVAKTSIRWLGASRVGSDFSDDVNDHVMIDSRIAPMVMLELWRHSAVVRSLLI